MDWTEDTLENGNNIRFSDGDDYYEDDFDVDVDVDDDDIDVDMDVDTED